MILYILLIIILQNYDHLIDISIIITGCQNRKDLSIKYIIFSIQLQVSTWSKDSHALYDYQTTDNKFYHQTFFLSNSSRIYRHINTMRTNIQIQTDTKDLPVQNIYIGTLLIDHGKFKLQSATISGIQPHLIVRQDYPNLFHNSYIVVRDLLHPYGYSLSPGNIIRLGRIQYAVLEIRTNNQTKTYKQTSHMEVNKGTHQITQNLEGSCKVCLCDQSTIQDPLIAPCLCKGSCQLIHVNCLKNWIYSKVKKQINGIADSYNFSKYQCQICKALFPKYVKLQNGQQVDMISIAKPNKPYIILQSLNDKNESLSKQQRNLHLITLQGGGNLKLGRGHQCQIRITDISVSRNHAEMRFQDNKFYVKDLNSKFGTLIKFKEEIEINSKLRIQYGRTVFQFNPMNSKQLETQSS